MWGRCLIVSAPGVSAIAPAGKHQLSSILTKRNIRPETLDRPFRLPLSYYPPTPNDCTFSTLWLSLF
jgi:hypothetical protein